MTPEPPSAARRRALLRHPSFALYWCSRILLVAASHMLAVAIGWQLYALSGRALDLGLVGLVMGGLGTIAVAALWARLFPELRHASTLDR